MSLDQLTTALNRGSNAVVLLLRHGLQGGLGNKSKKPSPQSGSGGGVVGPVRFGEGVIQPNHTAPRG